MVSLIVALAKNNVIGSKNRIPWLLRADLVRLKKLTQGQVVVLGRKTYESMVWYYEKSGREMPGKYYIVITTQKKYDAKNKKTFIVHSIDEALKKAGKFVPENIAVIGGEEIFKAVLPLVDTLYITEVDAFIEGDTFFPAIAKEQWQEISREPHSKDEKNQYDYSFLTLVRQKK